MTQTIESKGQRFVPTLGVLLDRLWVAYRHCLLVGRRSPAHCVHAILGQCAGGLVQPSDATRPHRITSS